MAWMFSCTISILALILLQSSPIAAQNNANITVGQSIIATSNGTSLLSPSGDFAFGFHQIPDNSNLFLLAIWYAKIPDTIVWYGYKGNLVTSGSSVKITANEGLILSDPHGVPLWNTTDELSGGAVNHGFLNDTGNFVLKNSSTTDAVWQSFDHPTDTLLPTQSMEINGVVNSRLSDTNFRQGRFQLRLISDGNLVLNTRDLTTDYAYGAYYTSGTNGQANANNSGQRLIYNKSGYMYILKKDGSRYDLLPPGKTVAQNDYYQRATLGFDGVLTWYSVSKTPITNDWNMVQTTPDNICITTGSPEPELGSGICGFNSICRLGNNNRPTCNCPQGYSLQDPNDTYGNCVPNFKQSVCEAQGQSAAKDKYELHELKNTNWPFGDYARLQTVSKEVCRSSCLNDCFCAAAIFNEHASTCWKKKLPLSNGMEDTAVTGITFLKVWNGNSSDNPTVINKKNHVVIAMLGTSVGVNFLLISATILGAFIMYNKSHSTCLKEHQSKTFSEYSSVRCFRYKELEQATDGFKEEIGRGAFGIVYKGKIGQRVPPIFVAVKKLDRISKDADKEFETEVNVIGQTHHKNLVGFIGFCKEDDQRLLVYEYMSNGTVADYLFGDLRPNWAARIQIAHDIAKGLLYLHEECSRQIIHCDIKPQNILLDDYKQARISDFGLAKLLVLNQTHTNTGIRGTKGYVAPEWFRNKPVTAKVDVYSFGVLLLEIICCRKSVCMELIEEQAAILTDWAFDCYQSNRFDSLVNDDMEALTDIAQLRRFVTVALWCIQEDPSRRPTMQTVTRMLDGLAEVPNNPPCPTSFSVTTQS
ncbi:G-type lectin S-receptor-like serine/threonine-protein kinase RLK1 [Chenopodium quinoa]|uniref:G-type lectin S-receptor-like serine/threonine-protein kinase RLK1 n=1 Tax=Chenopodium quinoa TaxID=63459 RepID=UPI000B79A807|nr:G-type lectin S-receptor-like serine/threonine-protein kinase RLK1 [Chenopodium quinoa]